MKNQAIEASKKLHSSNENYGKASEYERRGSMKYLLTLPKAIQESVNKYGTKSIIDHGTGKGGLVKALKKVFSDNIAIEGYDPAVEEYSKKPTKKYDIVCSIDVLEHIPKKEIDQTLEDISELTEGFFFFCIDLLPASKRMHDKRNAHFLIAPAEWWAQKIKQHFTSITCIEVGEMSDGSHYPIHLFGCATNSMKEFQKMNHFLENVEVANKRWVWDCQGTGISLRPY